MSATRWATVSIIVGLATAGLAMSEPMETCRQVLSDVIICSYTAINWTLLVVGLTAAPGGAASMIRRRHQPGEGPQARIRRSVVG